MDKVERKTLIPRDFLYLVMLTDKRTIKESNIAEGSTIEMSLRKKGGMEKDESMGREHVDASQRRHGVHQKGNNQRLEKIGRKYGDLCEKIGRKYGKINAIITKNTMERFEAMMNQSNGRVLNSVSLQIRGMNSTIEKMKDEGEDRYNKMDERITTMGKRDQ